MNDHFEDDADYKALYYFGAYPDQSTKVKAYSHKSFDGKVDPVACP